MTDSKPKQSNLSDAAVNALCKISRLRSYGLYELNQINQLLIIFIKEPSDRYFLEAIFHNYIDDIIENIFYAVAEDELSTEQVREIQDFFSRATFIYDKAKTEVCDKIYRRWMITRNIVIRLINRRSGVLSDMFLEFSDFDYFRELISTNSIPYRALSTDRRRSEKRNLVKINELKAVALIKQCVLENNEIGFRLTDRGLSLLKR
ncbi:hypothetical protein GMES_4406 [Paraglaciecola mesophila KMM 241]|uniref:Uncharacterized protein n=1 Tax=Paraglaciecola mesophila KMM 241 TaxID=1128912 RepID=K6Z8G0_9ALTE|nr:hypothetical protein [Paraglaciecola mesophila]GAC26672.1 hypothetical protein GMES_4406 [Paraglaciecola mesophila KMM 241]